MNVETPDRLYPPGTAPVPPKVFARPADPKVLPEPAKAPPEPVKLPPEPAIKPVPPPEPKKKAPVDDLLEPRPGAAEEARRLADLGLRAFRAGEYGLGLWRFRQASAVDPNYARAFFLLAQANLALGQFREAVLAIHDGLRLQPNWPAQDFRPRVDLYGDNLQDWLEHRRQLDDAVNRLPQDPALLFLRGYVAWFDGQRPLAVEWFQKARAATPAPRWSELRWIDLFLKHVPPPPAVAASN